MRNSLSMVREAARAIGLTLPKEREQLIAEGLETALKQAEAIRTSPTPVPVPTTYDAGWDTTK